MTMYAKPASSKEHQHESKSRSFKTLMIGNVSDLQEATQSEVVVGGGGLELQYLNSMLQYNELVLKVLLSAR
jgi:hypothetical protein